MKALTGKKGPLTDDSRRQRQVGDGGGKWNQAAQEYRKVSQGKYYISSDGSVYTPISLEAARKRGLHTFI